MRKVIVIEMDDARYRGTIEARAFFDQAVEDFRENLEMGAFSYFEKDEYKFEISERKS